MTALELIRQDESGVYSEQDIAYMLIKFAKYHVKLALESVIDNYEIDDYDEHEQYCPTLNENSILNAYSLENIK